MSTTLTNGLKLPDKGSVDWYADMQNNYTILDGAVGTVAEHTSALAGKAPAVHTHTKSDITDFPAYGNTAGTICEGNDSRLSDARTPVAHTHTKSDVTDLLNSNFIPSANNSYDLGSSSYQWNKLYAKNYYYNGTAWGLDKANVWTGENTFSAANLFRKSAFTLGDNSSQIVRMEYKDTNNSIWGILSFIQDTNNTVHCDIGVHALKTDGQTVLNKSVTLLVKPDDSSEFKPINDKAIDLGTSTNRWKTLNGLNPGALSLPSGAAENINTDNWNFSWGANTVTAPFDGYISVACFGSALQINNETKSYAMTFAPGTDGYICGLLPVSSGDSIKVLVTRTQTSIYEGYKFIKASGNVS